MVAMSAGSLPSKSFASNHFTGRLIEPYNWIWKPAYYQWFHYAPVINLKKIIKKFIAFINSISTIICLI